MIQRFQQVELIPADAVMAEAYPEAGAGGTGSGQVSSYQLEDVSHALCVLCPMPPVRANQS